MESMEAIATVVAFAAIVYVVKTIADKRKAKRKAEAGA